MLLKVILPQLEFDATAKRVSAWSYIAIVLLLDLHVMNFVIAVDVTIIKNQRIERKLSNKLLNEILMLLNLKLMSLGNQEQKFKAQMSWVIQKDAIVRNLHAWRSIVNVIKQGFHVVICVNAKVVKTVLEALNKASEVSKVRIYKCLNTRLIHWIWIQRLLNSSLWKKLPRQQRIKDLNEKSQVLLYLILKSNKLTLSKTVLIQSLNQWWIFHWKTHHSSKPLQLSKRCQKKCQGLKLDLKIFLRR